MDHQNSTMVDVTLLMIANRPTTADGFVGCVMKHVSGEDDESRWFDYRPGVLSPVTRVVWDKGTMIAVIPADTAEFLINRGYARLMTASEVEAFNAQLQEGQPSQPGGDK